MAKTPRLDESIDTEECCACFGQYSDDIVTGREWLECVCGRWVREDCVENIVYDTNGKEKLCPLCLFIVYSILPFNLLTFKTQKKNVYNPFFNNSMSIYIIPVSNNAYTNI